MRRAFWSLVAMSLLVTMPVISSQAEAGVQIHVLSNRADVISGGDALVAITVPDGADPADLTIELNGEDVTEAFAARADGSFSGVIIDLVEGENDLTATLPDDTGARITITNHPIGGPVFSGEQVQPWICTTQSNGLGAPIDDQCNAPTTYAYFYRSTNPLQTGFLSYDPSSPASDVATITTDEGNEVPYIVRRERGTANRGIYDIAVVTDPTQPWEPWDPQAGWNGKILYPFGASCGTVHSQSAPTGVMNDMALSRGFMVANSSMNVLGNNCDTVTSAESVMMLKERIAEQYGPIRYTIGSGCSGGSIGQHMVANNYPGLVDGIQPNCSYMDTWSTGIEVAECHLLLHYFTQVSPYLWAVPAQQAAVNGHQLPTSCAAWEALFAPVLDPKTGCGLPAEQIYHPESNPTGVRCTLPDFMLSVIGPRDESGFGKFPLDNVGIQYGLNALNSGLITSEQFVDVNEKIGAIDHDFNFIPERWTADPGSLQTLYQTGQINDGGSLDEVAIIDLRGTSNQEIHTDWHSYGMRARLTKANGHADNHVIWSSHVALVGDPAWTTESFLLLDRWLAAVEADPSDAPRAVKIVRNKPADAVDACWVAGRKITDMSVCRPLFPYYGSPRQAAGSPITHDIGKCTLKPLDRGDYRFGFSDEQWERLQAAFPDGVCDWAKPGVDKVPSIPWMTFKAGPGGQPLGDPPASEAL